MSKVCRNCQAEISWDPKERERIGYRGPLNPSDKSPHKCYGKVLEKFENIEDNPAKSEYVPPRPTMTDVTDPTLIMALTQLADSIRLLTLAQLASNDDERNDIRKRVLAQ